jgi:hypothetical protein
MMIAGYEDVTLNGYYFISYVRVYVEAKMPA